MSRLFVSHSSTNNAEAVALCEWLQAEGWKDLFLDLDPERGIAAGERWERALNEAASRCEAVLCLISRAWLDSRWCLKEFMLAHKLNKRLFGVLIESLDPTDLPPDLSGSWQLVDLASGRDHKIFRATLPRTQEECHVSFSREGLRRLRAGLVKAGLDPRFFEWPPVTDPNRPPYRGLRPLEAEDAGIFFGRDSPIVEALDKLRGLRAAAPPRLSVILGASGAGKSSFLRAGLLARMLRDEQSFLPLPIIRPERAVMTGETGLLRSLEAALDAAEIGMARRELRAAIEGGAATLRPVLQTLIEKAAPTTAEGHAAETEPIADDATRPAPTGDATQPAPTGGGVRKPPTLIISIDQGEELFLAEGQEQAQTMLGLLQSLLAQDAPAVIVIIGIRSDSYARLQEAKLLDGTRPSLFDLSPMPRGSYVEVIKGPPTRLEHSDRPLKIEEGLVEALLHDIEAGGAKDALPLLSFTLERLYQEKRGQGELTLADYQALGGIKGSIEEAVERAFTMADSDPRIPKDRSERLALLHQGLIPWLAGVDPDTRAPRRRVAELPEIPAECHPLLEKLVEQRLLATDVSSKTGEVTIEPAHEALLRQWGQLQTWLAEDEELLVVLAGIKRASREWVESGRSPTWLAHSGGRLAAAERLTKRRDFAANLDSADRDYLAACLNVELSAKRNRRRARMLVYALLVGIIIGLVSWINQSTIKDQFNWFTKMRPYMMANYRPHRLTTERERALRPGDHFRECAKDCPAMVVIPSGRFTMGSPAGPRHPVQIAAAFAVSQFDVTFDDWDACVSVGGCPETSGAGFGRGNRPVINVTWDDAQQYVRWLSKMTGQPYRLLTEAEWEYAARAGTTTTYWWGNDIGHGNANCVGCGGEWDGRHQTSPVDSFKPNPFGLYDMSGNVWQWLQDCYHADYDGAPTDGSAWIGGDCGLRTDRGGSWINNGDFMRVATRGNYTQTNRSYGLGFRVARTLAP